MKAASFPAIALALSLTAPALAADRVIYGGGDPSVSTYSGVMVPHVLEVLASANIGGYEWAGPTDGSAENVSQIEFNPFGFALGQSDVVLDKLQEGAPLKVYFPNLGPECFHVISQDGSTFADALDGSVPIYVGSQLSGSAYSVGRLLREGYGIDPASIDVRYSSATDAASGGVGVFVQRPDPNASVYKDRADAGFTFSGIASVDAELAGYTPLQVTVKDSGVLLGIGAKSNTFDTTCMTTVLFGHDASKLEAGSREARYLTQLVLPKLKGIDDTQMVPPSEGNWLSSLVDQVNTASSAAADKGGSILDQLNELRN